MMPSVPHRTRVCHLLASGAGVILRHNEASLQEMVVYAARSCSLVDPITQEVCTRFDFGAPPPQASIPFQALLALARDRESRAPRGQA